MRFIVSLTTTQRITFRIATFPRAENDVQVRRFDLRLRRDKVIDTLCQYIKGKHHLAQPQSVRNCRRFSVPNLQRNDQHFNPALPILWHSYRPCCCRSLRNGNDQDQPGVQQCQLSQGHAGYLDSVWRFGLFPLSWSCGTCWFRIHKIRGSSHGNPLVDQVRSLKSQDLDLRRARKTVIAVSVVSLVVLLFVHVNLFGLRL
jgi:hypothetical protein